jgi:hypothetical protein
MDPKAHGWFDVEDHPVAAAARHERLAAARAGFDMGVAFNELNRVFALGFKPLPWGDNGYVPATMQLAGGPPPTVDYFDSTNLRCSAICRPSLSDMGAMLKVARK